MKILVQEQMEAVGIEGFLVGVAYGCIKGRFVHDYDVRAQQMKGTYKITSPHS